MRVLRRSRTRILTLRLAVLQQRAEYAHCRWFPWWSCGGSIPGVISALFHPCAGVGTSARSFNPPLPGPAPILQVRPVPASSSPPPRTRYARSCRTVSRRTTSSAVSARGGGERCPEFILQNWLKSRSHAPAVRACSALESCPGWRPRARAVLGLYHPYIRLPGSRSPQARHYRRA